MSCRNITIEHKFGHISAVEWHAEKNYKRRVIALHGWLDNAASFNILAPLIEAHIIAIDSAGHGLSSHRSLDANYNIWEDTVDIVRVANHFNWDNFELLAHSRGAGIASIYAGARPSTVSHLYLIDGGVPRYFELNVITVSDRINDIIDERLSEKIIRPSLFKTREDAIKGRAMGMIPIPYEAAEQLATRGLLETGDGQFYWNNDQRLKNKTFYISEAQLVELINNYNNPTDLFLADEGIIKMYEWANNPLIHKSDINVHKLQGSHHLHMEQAAQDIANIVNSKE